MLTFVTKDIPRKLISSLKSQIVTSLEITSSEIEFNAIAAWIERRGLSRKFRSLRVRNQQLSAGFGKHLFIHGRRLFWVSRLRVENKDDNLEELILTCLGRSQEPLRDLVIEAKLDIYRTDQTRIYHRRYSGWRLLTSQPKRNWDSVFLPHSHRVQIESHLKQFFESKEWYRKFGIPYRTGICLHGLPGTGKTSLVKAICAEYGLGLYAIDLSGITDQELKETIGGVGSRALILLEDIDTVAASKGRGAAKEKNSNKNDSAAVQVTLGGLLNAVDGIIDSDGRVFVMTTNHIEWLDPALLRPGRVDLSLELGVMTPEMFQEAFLRFFPKHELPLNMLWRDDVVPAQFQSLLLRWPNDFAEILARVAQVATEAKQFSNCVNLRS